MKERLDRENIEALAAYRFQRAEETIMPQSLYSSNMS